MGEVTVVGLMGVQSKISYSIDDGKTFTVNMSISRLLMYVYVSGELFTLSLLCSFVHPL